MIIDHVKKFVFIAVPKTASCSLQYQLGEPDGWPEPAEHHMGIRRVAEEHPFSDDYFTCGFVRNPWDRLFSLYNDFTLKRIKQYSRLVILDEPLFSEFKNFNDFCVRFKDSQWTNDIFLRPQSELLTYKDGTEVNFIGRFESLDRDFKVICDKLDINKHPMSQHKKINAGVYQGTYREAYTKDAIDAVAKFYQEDVERFEYEF